MILNRKIEFVKQRDAMQCGVASLAMVASYWGKRVAVDTLEEVCQPGKDGINLLGISKAAERIGLKSQAMMLSPEDLGAIDLPAIVHWRQNHFVVLWKITRKHLYVADPAKGMTRYRPEEFADAWVSTGDGRGIAMSLTPGESFVRDREKSDAREVFEFVLGYVRQYKTWLLHVLAGLLVGCVLQLVLPFLTQAVVDRGINGRDIGIIWMILLGELFIVAGSTAVDFMRRWILLHISMRVNLNLVSDFFIKLFKLPMGFFDTKHMGDLLQRIGDHARVQEFLTGQVLSVFFSCVSFVVLSVVLLVYDYVIYAVFMIGSVIYGGWIALFLSRRRILDYEIFEKQATNQNKTYQLVNLMQEIKLQGCETRRRQEWEDNQADLFVVQMKSMKLQQTQEAGSVFINETKNIIITVLAAGAVINGEITFGAMLAIQYIIGQLNSPVSQFVSFIHSIQDLKISLERINEVQRRPNEEISEEAVDAVHSDGSVVLDNVTFRYDKYSPLPTIDGINLTIPKGKVTAIVGASGSGKTTLIKLMLGYYHVDSGRMIVDGNDMKDISVRQWRRQCGVVMQDGAIFSESIARNIAVDDGEIDMVRLESAARLAMIHDYVASLPMKYDTSVGAEGRGLSQGQRQRLLIARAIYRNPRFIFLDEATNSLDAENERAITDNLQEVYRDKTVVVVAHRLSTVRSADQIVVLDHGKIAETGTHESLTAMKGMYYSLVKNQLELGQ